MVQSSQDDGVKPFINKLWSMVNNPSTSSTMTWTPDGSALTIIGIEPFVSELLPLYFKHSNLSSFVRQLNTYGFSKVDSSSAYVYSHPAFHRDFPERMTLIQRKNSHHAGPSTVPMPDDPLPQGIHSRVVPRHGSAPTGKAVPPALPAEARAELESIFTTMRRMESRIGELSSEVKAARMQQVDTRGAMGKLMEFLSHVYNDHKRPAAPAVTSGIHDVSAKRPRLSEAPAYASGSFGSNGLQSPTTPMPRAVDVTDAAEMRLPLAVPIAPPQVSMGAPGLLPMQPLLPVQPPPVLPAYGGAPASATCGGGAQAVPVLPLVGALVSMPTTIANPELPTPLAANPAANPSLNPSLNHAGGVGGVGGVYPPGAPPGGSAVVASASMPRGASMVLPSLPSSASPLVGGGGKAPAPAPMRLAADGKAPLVTPPGVLPPAGLARSTSLGAHVALALPPDLREFALEELVGSTELQDLAIQEVVQAAPSVSRQVSGASAASTGAGEAAVGGVGDAEDYLWDFLEASQDMADAGEATSL